MPTRLGADEMLAVVERHGQFEGAHDWDGTLTTMTADPVYLYYPWRLRCASVESITEAWILTFSFPFFNQGASPAGPSTTATYVNDDSVARIRNFSFRSEDGLLHPSTLITTYTFDGPLIRTEAVFMDVALTTYMDEAFGAEFRAIPGVDVF